MGLIRETELKVIRLAPSGDPVEVQVFLNKYLGIPIFLTVLWTMFQFAFAVSLLFGLIAKEVVVGIYGILLRIWGGKPGRSAGQQGALHAAHRFRIAAFDEYAEQADPQDGLVNYWNLNRKRKN